MGNHLGSLPEASDGPEGQEPPVRAVGGQGRPRGVTQLLCKLEIWVFLKPQVFWVWGIIWDHFQNPQIWPE